MQKSNAIFSPLRSYVTAGFVLLGMGCGSATPAEEEVLTSQAQALWGGEASSGALSSDSAFQIPLWSGKDGTHKVRVYTKDKSYCKLEIALAWKRATDPSFHEFNRQTVWSYVDSPYEAELRSGSSDIGYQITVINRSGVATTAYYKLNTPTF